MIFWLYSLCDLWCDKFLDFDRMAKFWFVLYGKSIDFAGVLSVWRVVNWLVLMCYFFIKYEIFGRVRLKPWFIRVWEDFGVVCGDFWWCEKWWNAWFCWVCSKWVSNSKWRLRREKIRCALLIIEHLFLKCKPTGDAYEQTFSKIL